MGIFPMSCTADSFFVKQTVDVAIVQYDLLKNGAPSGITCTIGIGGTTCSDVTHTVAFSPGDTVTTLFTGGTGPTASVSWRCK
jgi:hypothetical protein